MDVPQVFVSSTCYDLNEVRRQLEKFIEELGFKTVMSDTTSFKVEKKKHSLDACIHLIPDCHFFVLIIGSRYGSKFKLEDKSITNKEYEVAVKHGLYIYPFVKKDVWNNLQIYNQNPGKDIKYPFVDDPKLFEFINEVQTASKDNFIWTFENSEEIIATLRNQFAYLFHDLLNKEMRVYETERHFEGRSKCIIAMRLGWLLRQLLIFLPLGEFNTQRAQDSVQFINEILQGYRMFVPDEKDDVEEFKKIKNALLDGSFFVDDTSEERRRNLIKLHLNQRNLEQELRLRLSGIYKYYFMLGHTLGQITLVLTHDNFEYGGSRQDNINLLRDQIDRTLKNIHLSKELEERIYKLVNSLDANSTLDDYFLEAQMIIQDISLFLES